MRQLLVSILITVLSLSGTYACVTDGNFLVDCRRSKWVFTEAVDHSRRALEVRLPAREPPGDELQRNLKPLFRSFIQNRFIDVFLGKAVKFVNVSRDFKVRVSPSEPLEGQVYQELLNAVRKYGIKEMLPREPNDIERISGHIYGHLMAKVLNELEVFPPGDLMTRLRFAGFRSTGGMIHTFVHHHIMELARGQQNVSGWKLVTMIAQNITPIFLRALEDSMSETPTLPHEAVPEFAHGALHGLSLILQASGIDQTAPIKLYNACSLFDEKLLHHYCIWAVYHTYAHPNPEHFYDWNTPGFASAVTNCANLPYAPALCYIQRAFWQAEFTPTPVRKQLQICTLITNPDHRLGCLMSLAHGENGLNPELVTVCESLPSSSEQFACVAGAASTAVLPKPPIPCQLFRTWEHISWCEFARSICETRLVADCIYILYHMALPDGTRGKETDFSWLPVFPLTDWKE